MATHNNRPRRRLKHNIFPSLPTNSTLAVTLAFLLFSSSWDFGDGVGLHKEDNEFCYSDPECGPDSHHWGDLCQNGLRQSPIPLPIHAPVLPGVTALHLHSYRGDSFRMQNNGHTVHLEFLEPPDSYDNGLGSGGLGVHGGFGFPDPLALARFGRDERIFYRFDSAHFHWGSHDDRGSEHCFDDRCFSMELHLVHYLSTFSSMEEAMDSGDPNALAVIAVMLDATPAAGEGNPILGPIVNNLFQIEEPSHDQWTYVNAPLDFTRLLATRGQNFMYTYKVNQTKYFTSVILL